jgi:hypothetical protein
MSVGPGDGHARGGNHRLLTRSQNAEMPATFSRIGAYRSGQCGTIRGQSLASCPPADQAGGVEESCRKSTPIVAYHNSWPYFARRFRLDFAGFIETKPGVPPSPAHLAGIVKTMRERGVRIVVREPHEPERDVAFVASKAGASVVMLAASVGALPEASDYISLFDVNVESLKSAAAR